MAFTKLTDIYDPVKVMAIIGDEWLDEAEMIATGIISREAKPNKGTLTYWLREFRFQDTSGQAVVAGGSISSQKRTQQLKQHPVVWRYNSADEPDVIEEIEEKDAQRENVGLATEIREASTQYADDSIVSVIKGTGDSLTANQSDQSGSVVTLVAMVKGFSVLKDRGLKIQGGAMAMRDNVYWKLVELGLVSATSNTFGNINQHAMVLSGQLPVNVLGMTPIISNKFTDLGSNKFYIYYIGQSAVTLKGRDVPEVEIARKTVKKEFGTVTNFKISYGIGFKGVSWGLTGKENVTDAELETAGNWSLATTNAKLIKLSRVKVKTA